MQAGLLAFPLHQSVSSERGRVHWKVHWGECTLEGSLGRVYIGGLFGERVYWRALWGGYIGRVKEYGDAIKCFAPFTVNLFHLDLLHPNGDKVMGKQWYSRPCFERPLNFTMENGRKSRVVAQSKVGKVDSIQNRSVGMPMEISGEIAGNTNKIRH